MFVYPDFISDLHVVASAKFDSCSLEDRDMDEKMIIGDSYHRFMHYHPEEMGFGRPYVCFAWNEDGWIMTFRIRHLNYGFISDCAAPEYDDDRNKDNS